MIAGMIAADNMNVLIVIFVIYDSLHKEIIEIVSFYILKITKKT